MHKKYYYIVNGYITEHMDLFIGTKRVIIGAKLAIFLQNLEFVALFIAKHCLNNDVELASLPKLRFSSYRADTVFVMDKVPRKISQKVIKAELPYLHYARHLMLIDICIKFHEYSLSSFQVIERTRFCDAQSSKENNSKSIKGRVTILALCTSSHAD